MTDKPYFRFHADAYERSFEPSKAPCDLCARPCEWLYVGGLYVAGEEPKVCARCIGDGTVRRHFSADHVSFVDTDFSTPADVDAELMDEVLTRTPGFSTFNPFQWPVLDRRPLAFMGYGDDKAIWDNADARAAMLTALTEIFGEDGAPGPSAYALVFKEIDGPRYVAVVDLD